jgi:hypothetical protein
MNDEVQTPQFDELSWLALRYVSGELTDEETVAFEERLGNEEAACEAVSIAVQTSFAVRTAFDSGFADPIVPARTDSSQTVSVTPVADRNPPKSARWISLSVSAVALLLVLSVANFRDPDSTSEANAERNRELAVLWTQAGPSPESDEIEIPVIAENENAALTASEDRLPPVDLVADVPEWMLVALQKQHGVSGDDDEILEN